MRRRRSRRRTDAPARRADDSTLARWTLHLVDQTLPPGAQRSAFLERHALDGVTDRDARISDATTRAIWHELTDDGEDPLLGVRFARELPTSAVGIVGYLAMTCETALDGLRRVEAFYRVLKSAGAMRLAERGRHVTVIDGPPRGQPAWPRHLTEAVLFTYKAFIERFTGREIVPRAVRMQHRAAPGAGALEAAFGAPIAFDAVENAIVFGAADLARRSVACDAILHDYLLLGAERVLATLPRSDDTLVDLESAIASALPSGDVSLARAARAMGIGARTLQRRLRDRALTFQGVVDGVRRGVADRLLQDPSLSLKEVAFLLGFSDPRAFRRAQRRWTAGHAPAGDVGARAGPPS